MLDVVLLDVRYCVNDNTRGRVDCYDIALVVSRFGECKEVCKLQASNNRLRFLAAGWAAHRQRVAY